MLSKEEKEIKKAFLDYLEFVSELKQENELLQQENKDLRERQINWYNDEAHKYEQALEEIRNIAELEVMLDKNLKTFYPTNIQRILDKINEVLE